MVPRSLRLLSVLLVLVPALAGAATIRVPADRRTLTAAVRAAHAGDEIVLAPGRYSSATGERFPIRMSGKSLHVRGAGAFRTILDAGNTARHFRFTDGDSGSVADLRITGGGATDGGGAVLVESAAPSFTRIVFAGNRASADGDVVRVQGGAPRFAACLFEANDGKGPTSCVDAGTPAFVRCTWGGNAGPALEVRGQAQPRVSGCIVARPGTGEGAALGLRLVAEPDAPGPVLSDNLFLECEDGVVRVDGEAGLALAAALDGARRDGGLRRATVELRDPDHGDWRLPAEDDDAGTLGAFAGRDALPEPPAWRREARESLLAPSLLGPSVPNPSAPSTTIHFRVPEPSLVDLGVYNVVGVRVRTLPAGDLGTGEHERLWDGRDDHGEDLPPGIYFVRITIGTAMESRRIVLVR